MAKLIDLSVAVNSKTLSPPSTNLRVEITPHRRRVPFYAPFYKIEGTEGALARFFAQVERVRS